MCNKHMHSTVTRSSRFYCLIVVINKPTTVELCISPVYRRLAVAKFSLSPQCRNCSRDTDTRPLREYSLITQKMSMMMMMNYNFKYKTFGSARMVCGAGL